MALDGVRSGKLTTAQARRLLGIKSRYEMDGFLKAHGVFLSLTIEDVRRDSESGLGVQRLRRIWCAAIYRTGFMMTLETLRAERREDVLRLAQRHGAHNVRVFGSVARGEASEQSDVDMLVDWEPGRSLLDHVALVQDLEDALDVKVHIGTERSLHWYVKDRILREAIPL